MMNKVTNRSINDNPTKQLESDETSNRKETGILLSPDAHRNEKKRNGRGREMNERKKEERKRERLLKREREKK